MASLKCSEMRIIDEIFEMRSGYVLNFSDRTMSEFFEDELGIEIYDEKYGFNGTSKAKHVRAFIKIEDGYIVGQFLRAYLGVRTTKAEMDALSLHRDEFRGDWNYALHPR